jgi:hypothetical protein
MSNQQVLLAFQKLEQAKGIALGIANKQAEVATLLLEICQLLQTEQHVPQTPANVVQQAMQASPQIPQQAAAAVPATRHACRMAFWPQTSSSQQQYLSGSFECGNIKLRSTLFPSDPNNSNGNIMNGYLVPENASREGGLKDNSVGGLFLKRGANQELVLDIVFNGEGGYNKVRGHALMVPSNSTADRAPQYTADGFIDGDILSAEVMQGLEMANSIVSQQPAQQQVAVPQAPTVPAAPGQPVINPPTGLGNIAGLLS